MENRIFIGVDGGGTKTKAIAINENGAVLGRNTGGGINFYTIPMDKARQTLKDILDGLIAQVNIPGYDSLYIGMSALDHLSPPELLAEFCG